MLRCRGFVLRRPDHYPGSVAPQNEEENEMSYLLDTGVWLWSVGEPARMSPSAREIFADRTEELFLSAVTSWEAAIKGQVENYDFQNRRGPTFQAA
jgi:hypothetical protein